jgi:hypothetical protein
VHAHPAKDHPAAFIFPPVASPMALVSCASPDRDGKAHCGEVILPVTVPVDRFFRPSNPSRVYCCDMFHDMIVSMRSRYVHDMFV